MLSLRPAIAASAHRGAWIRLVTSGLQDRSSSSKRAIETLLEGEDGAWIRPRLRVLTPHEEWTDLVHAKVLVVDGSHGYLGSANLSLSGLDRNFEIGVALDSSQANAFDALISYLEANGTLRDLTEAVLGSI